MGLIGEKIGRLEIVERVKNPNPKRRGTTFLCKCECGGTKVANKSDLVRGMVKSCGCLGGGKIKDITGQKFGRLVCVRQNGNEKKGGAKWLCRCECGNETTVSSWHLRSGQVRSCGCLTKEHAARLGRRYGGKFGRVYKSDEEKSEAIKRQKARAKVKAREKTRKLLEENRDAVLSEWRAEQREGIKNLSDRYVNQKIRDRTGIPTQDITDEMRALKREQLLFSRELLKLKKGVANGIA